MLQRNTFNPKYIKILVLDEADQLLATGFKDQIYDIFQLLQKGVQSCLFSSTIPPEMLAVTKRFMTDPLKILIPSTELTLEGATALVNNSYL